MKKQIKYIIPVFIVACSYSCKDFFEEDISEELVVALAPADNLVTDYNTLTFWWEYLDDADMYNLQIVSPSYESVERLILDTNITANKFEYTLEYGFYEWSVIGYNHSSSSRYTIQSLIVGDSVILSDLEVAFQYPPLDSFLSNNNTITFDWYEVPGARNYCIKITEDNWTNGDVFYSDTTENDTLTVTLDEGLYYYGVQALNTQSSTDFTIQSIFIDTTQPEKPVLVFPENDSTYTDLSLTFRWNQTMDDGSEIFDSIFLSSSPDMEPSALIFSESAYDTVYSTVLSDTGTYFWQVQSFDEAGNTGPKSDVWKFTIH